MTSSPASVSVLALAGCLAGASLMLAVRPAFAQAAKAFGQSLKTGSASVLSVANSAAEPIKNSPSFLFDIPAQPLAFALDRYAVITGHSVLFPSKLAAGRNASALIGRYDADEALELLLQGTGLSADHLHEAGLDTFVLKTLSVQEQANRLSAKAAKETQAIVSEAYDALVQTRVWEILCSHARTAPGSYRALLRLRVDAAGQVRQPRLLSSTGDKRRDVMLIEVLGKMTVGEAPPAGLIQPLTILLLPQEQIAGQPCRTEVR